MRGLFYPIMPIFFWFEGWRSYYERWTNSGWFGICRFGYFTIWWALWTKA